jgi:uncharacterized protein (TIGR02246 family)
METTWNVGDGAAYAAHFADEADFVVIDGRHLKGRTMIAAGHQRIFDTIYRDSRNSGTVEAVRALGPDIALVRVAWHLRVPTGGAGGELRARNTLVLTKAAAGWLITSFHNTRIAEQ